MEKGALLSPEGEREKKELSSPQRERERTELFSLQREHERESGRSELSTLQRERKSERAGGMYSSDCVMPDRLIGHLGGDCFHAAKEDTHGRLPGHAASADHCGRAVAYSMCHQNWCMASEVANVT